MLNPVVIPLETVPNANTPVNAGASVTKAPGIGVNVLLGVVDDQSWAVTVMVVPTSDNAVVVLKYAEIDVIVPLLGDENASLRLVPALPVRSIVDPNGLAVALLPNPRSATAPEVPPKNVVKVKSVPDENGMILPALLPLIAVHAGDPVVPLL